MGFNSTIITKKKPCKSCGRVDYLFSRGRCAQCAKVEDFAKRQEKETEKMIVEEDLSDLIKDLDAIFSQWVRLSAANKDGLISCFICGASVHWRDAQNMHYIKRGVSLFLRFDPRNNKAGCRTCNETKAGNYIEYAKKLEAENPGITEILYEEGNLVSKPTISELKGLISEYASKVKHLGKKINNSAGR